MCVRVCMCEPWTSYYQHNVGHGSPAVSMKIRRFLITTSEKIIPWQLLLCFLTEKKTIKCLSLIGQTHSLHCFICVTWTLMWMNRPFQRPSTPGCTRCNIPSFCATDCGTVTPTDCPLGDEPSSSCQSTAWGLREPVMWRVCCVPGAGLMINTLGVTRCFLDVRSTTSYRLQIHSGASHPWPLPPPSHTSLILRRHIRYKESSPSHLMIRLGQEAEIILNSLEN